MTYKFNLNARIQGICWQIYLKKLPPSHPVITEVYGYVNALLRIWYQAII